MDKPPYTWGSSARFCEPPHYSGWGSEEDAPPDWIQEMPWSPTELAEEQSGPWPSLAYFGPPLEKAIRLACPLYHDGDSGYVYHLLERWHRVLYVGKSKYPSQRIFQHGRKSWWGEVCKVRIFASTEYDELEREDIHSLRPQHNIERYACRASEQ